MTRHEIEEAVANAQQLLITMRGVKGLVEICEISLNHTKLVDGLAEKKVSLEADIAKLEQDKQTHSTRVEAAHIAQAQEHTRRIEQLKREEKVHQERVDKLNLEYAELKRELERKHAAELVEFNAWMKDCHEKQIAANESVATVTRQLDAIRAKLG